MKNVKIKYRIFALSAGALIGMLIFSGYLLIEKRHVSSEMENLNELARLGPAVSALVHEMQRERGASAGFIGSKGQKFTRKLPKQREQTNAKNAALTEAFNAFDVAAYSLGLVRKVEATRKALARLGGDRGQVSGLSIAVPQMAGYYTPTIAKLLSIVEEMAVLSTNAEVANAITAYTAFLQGKERAGLERAMGSVGFSAGRFAPPIYRRFLQLIAMEDTFLGVFRTYATAEQKALYERTVSGHAVDEANRMREIAIESITTGDTGGIEGTDWFDTITHKINHLKTVEDKIAGNLRATAARISDEARSTFYMVTMLSAVLLALTVALSFYIVRSITTPVVAMTEAMGRLAKGDYVVEVPALGQTDEVGEMAQSVQVFKDNAIHMRQMREEQKQAAEEKRLAEEERRRMVEERREAGRKAEEDKRQTEQLAQALQKEQELNTLQRDFVSLVSHEFRTPLTIIDGAAQRLVRRKEMVTPEDLVARTDKIRAAVQRMTGLIEGTLYASRLDAGAIRMERQPCDLKGLIREVCARQAEISQFHDIRVDVAGLPEDIHADPKLLDQVFTNLMSNAVKYTPDDPHIEVKGWTDGDFAAVSVRDHGVGVPADDLPRLCERFFRARTSTGITGTGIGLNLVKQLMEMHQGTIEVDSVEGQGSVFTVRLPIDLRAAGDAAQGTAARTTPVLTAVKSALAT